MSLLSEQLEYHQSRLLCTRNAKKRDSLNGYKLNKRNSNRHRRLSYSLNNNDETLQRMNSKNRRTSTSSNKSRRNRSSAKFKANEETKLCAEKVATVESEYLSKNQEKAVGAASPNKSFESLGMITIEHSTPDDLLLDPAQRNMIAPPRRIKNKQKRVKKSKKGISSVDNPLSESLPKIEKFGKADKQAEPSGFLGIIANLRNGLANTTK